MTYFKDANLLNHSILSTLVKLAVVICNNLVVDFYIQLCLKMQQKCDIGGQISKLFYQYIFFTLS